ncbi:MAG TPA: hypothetical protein PK308_00730 [Phycisphaerales bacterium]|jgi:hypothetical protein|nr:hypothetical protein [Phycisphaerales bacterium]
MSIHTTSDLIKRGSRSGNWLRASLVAACAGLCVLLAAPASYAGPDPKTGDKKDEAKTDQVELIFRSGRTVKGTLIKENETSITVKVNVAGITAETTYQKSEILAINRNQPADGSASKDDKKDEKKDDKKGDDDKANSPDSSAKGPVIYMVTFTGEFGRDVSSTPIKQLVADIKKVQPDILLCRFDMAFAHWGEESPDYSPIAGQYDVLETARGIATYFTDDIMRDPEFKKKPRMVGWVKKALGGAAFLPFIFPELYYTSDAHHGGIGYLEHMFDGRGDDRAREKQYSLRLGRAEGMAAIGGYSPLIIRAMSRADYVLSYRIEGGQVVYLENQMPSGPSEFLLTDDGKGENRDSMPDILRFKANDVLTLDAPTAERLGISKGTCNKLDEVLLKLGIDREYKLVEGDSKKILSDWSEAVAKAEHDITNLLRQYTQVQVREPGRYKERTEARGQRKRLLLAVKAQLDRYGEAINPRAIRGMPQDLIGQIDLVIYQIEQEQRLDRPD